MGTRRIGIGNVSSGKKKKSAKPEKPKIAWGKIKTMKQLNQAIEKANGFADKLDTIDKKKAESEKVKAHVEKVKAQFAKLK